MLCLFTDTKDVIKAFETHGGEPNLKMYNAKTEGMKKDPTIGTHSCILLLIETSPLFVFGLMQEKGIHVINISL